MINVLLTSWSLFSWYSWHCTAKHLVASICFFFPSILFCFHEDTFSNFVCQCSMKSMVPTFLEGFLPPQVVLCCTTCYLRFSLNDHTLDIIKASLEDKVPKWQRVWLWGLYNQLLFIYNPLQFFMKTIKQEQFFNSIVS